MSTVLRRSTSHIEEFDTDSNHITVTHLFVQLNNTVYVDASFLRYDAVQIRIYVPAILGLPQSLR